MSIEKKAREISAAIAEWQEDILAGLLSNGVPKEDIVIVDDVRTKDIEILVKGVERYRLDYGALTRGEIRGT